MTNNEILELLKSEGLIEIAVGEDEWVEGYKGNKKRAYIFVDTKEDFKEDENTILTISKNGIIIESNLTFAYNEYIKPRLFEAVARRVFGY